ncbi:thioredoxin family protein [Formosa sp. S-31]|uniref:thioredoxin family protein n=1 Tax=Formosa sp. S-31 TaxID=2790949 RepID=UPI003EBA4F68
MKIYKILLLTFLLLAFNGYAQGINFEHITLEEAFVKAKQENKQVFIDFYTVWCGPCKKMARDIFPLASVGEVYNKNFINLKLDAEKEGEAVAKQYNVTGYPTLLYLDTDGKVLLKDTAFKHEDLFLEMAQRAVSSIDSQYSLENLKKEFPNKLNDEAFLKMYITKMEEYGQRPVEGVDAWLRVQTEMEEASPEMKDYIMHNVRSFTVGSKGEQILDENYETYMKSASKFEAKMLPRLKTQILNNTIIVAERKNDPELVKAYIDAYKERPADKIKQDDLVEAELMYFVMINDGKSYKQVVENYVDSLMNKTSVAEINAEDEKTYQMYKKAYDRDPIESRERMLHASKEGLIATKILKEINEKGQGYLDFENSKEEYKTVKSWIKYGYKLKPENCFTDDLQAAVYYKKGKTKKAVELKERAVKNWPKTDKKFVNKEYELVQMKKGESI